MTRTATSRPRLKDIANIANISIATASMALADHPRVNDDTKRRVREIGRQIGYRIKARPTPVDPRRLGLLIVGGSGHDSVTAPLMLHLSQAGHSQQARFELASTPLDMPEDQVIQRAIHFAKDLDGVMLVDLVTPALLDALAKQHVSTLVIGDMHGSFLSAPGASLVSFDTLAMGYQATMHLLSQGHEHIGFATETMPPGLSHERWYRGHCLALIEKGISPRPQLKFVGQRHEGLAGAVDAFTKLRQSPTAYIVPDTREAVNFVTVAASRNMKLAPGSVVFQALSSSTVPQELAGMPYMVGDLQTLARESIARLMAVEKHETLPPCHVLVPHVFHHLT